jgi:DNA polymerase-3 subunit delta
MKFYLSQLKDLFDKIEKGQIKAILLYGPDKGYISKICELLIKKFNLLQTDITYQNLKAPQLQMMINSKNFFSKRELIKISSVTASIDQSLQVVLKADFFHFVVFIADELSTNAVIRKFFEIETNLASIACYHDDEQNILKIILKRLKLADKQIDEDALFVLKSSIRGDHKLINSEIDKLIYFAFDKTQITLDDVTSVISSDNMANGDDLCVYFVRKNLHSFLNELSKLKQQCINEVLIIRALIRYYINLYIVLSKVEDGKSIDESIKSLSPPIFFKYIADFKVALNGLSTRDVLVALFVLQEAEVSFKKTPESFDFYHQIYLKIHN